MLREIPFYFVVFIGWIWPLLLAMGVFSILGKLLEKPKAAPPVETPVEAAASKARALAMFAEIQQMRNAHHH